MSGTLAYRLRLRDFYDTIDVLTVTSLRGGANPFITSAPSGDGTSIDVITGRVSVGGYRLTVADEIGTVYEPTLIFEETWDYVDQAARNAVWAKTSSLAASYAGGDNAGFGGKPLHVGVTYGGGIGGGGGYAKHTLTLTSADGIVAGQSYTVVCDRVTFSRELGALDDTGISINGGAGERIPGGSLDGPIVLTGIADGGANLVVTLGHFDLEYGMAGIVITYDRIRVFGNPVSVNTRVVTGALGDGEGRWQAVGSRCYLDESTNNGGAWTQILGAFLTNVRLAGGINYELSLGESDRRERALMAFTKEEGPFTASRLIGAPAGFGPLPDSPFEYWVFKVKETGATSGALPGDAVVLDFQYGYMYEKTAGNEGIVLMNGEISNEARNIINATSPTYASGSSEGSGKILLDGLTVRVFDTAGNLVTDSLVPYGWGGFDNSGYAFVGEGTDLIRQDRLMAVQWVGTLPSVGTTYRVLVVPDTVGEHNPLHFSGHPVDFVKALFASRNVAYDETSADTVKAALGPALRVRYRFERPEALFDAAEKYAFGPFGFAVRPDDAGVWYFIVTRGEPSGTPSEAHTALTLHDPTAVAFNLDVAQAFHRVIWRQQRWTAYKESMGGDAPIDGVVGRETTTIVEPSEAMSPDTAVREIVYELPGDLLIKSGTGGGSKVSGADQWYIAHGQHMLRRWGRGCPEATLPTLRGTSTARVGDFVLLTLAHRPNIEDGRTPTAQRGGARIVQVVHRTVTPSGPVLDVLDVGPDDTAGVVPTFTLALSSDDPRHTAEYTITNSGALAGHVVRIEIATGAAPAGNGTTVGVVTPDADPHALPSEEACTEIFVRMRAELIGGGVPGTWSAWDSITLDCIPAVTALAAAAGAVCTEQAISWTVGDADLAVRVRWRLTAGTEYLGSVPLPAGSTGYTISGLTVSTGYTVIVDHLDRAPYTGDGADASATFTTCGTVPTLGPPIDPVCFTEAGGMYGLEVTATEFPSNVVFEEAVETAVGSGTPGTYSIVSVQASVPGRIRYEATRANDGKRVYVRAYHERAGWTSSSTVGACDLDPWGDPPNPVPSGALRQTTDTVMLWSGTDGEGRTLGSIRTGRLAMQYCTDTSDPSDDANWAFIDEDDDDEGPYVPLDVAGPIPGAWAPAALAYKGGAAHAPGADMLHRVVTVDNTGAVALLAGAQRFWKYTAGIQSVRMGAEVVIAGTPSVDPKIENVWCEFNAATLETAEPPDPEPPAAVALCTAPDYPVARALIALHHCDCGTWNNDGTGDKNVVSLTDFSGLGNTLGGGSVSGAWARRLTKATGPAIPAINGHNFISFRDAWLQWPVGMFTGITAAEMFLLVKGDNGDPTAFHDRFASWVLGPSTGGEWAEGVGAAGTGRIVEDFGSSSWRDLGNAPGSLDTVRVYNVRAASGLFVAALDGTDFYTDTSNTVAFSANPRMGNRGAPTAGNSDVLIGAIAIHAAILSVAERASAVAFMRAVGGL